MRTGVIGVVARWKPVHLAHAALLEALAARGALLRVGIGSANRYGPRNPFTPDESAAMVEAVLRPTGVEYRLVFVPDLGDGPRWRELVRELLGPLDLFVSANAYVRRLMEPIYPLAHPLELIDPTRRTPVTGTAVRRAWARGEPWEHLVPPPVADYLAQRRLPERFRREFGLATLALELEAPLPPAEAEERNVRVG